MKFSFFAGFRNRKGMFSCDSTLCISFCTPLDLLRYVREIRAEGGVHLKSGALCCDSPPLCSPELVRIWGKWVAFCCTVLYTTRIDDGRLLR